jgi:hypothetical protein
VIENEMIIYRAKSKAVCFTRARVTELLNYSSRDIVIPEASSCKYLGTGLHSNLSWANQVNFTVKKSLEGTSLYNAYSEKGKTSSTKSLAYTSLVRPILEYGAALFKAYTGEQAWKAIYR